MDETCEYTKLITAITAAVPNAITKINNGLYFSCMVLVACFYRAADKERCAKHAPKERKTVEGNEKSDIAHSCLRCVRRRHERIEPETEAKKDDYAAGY